MRSLIYVFYQSLLSILLISRKFFLLFFRILTILSVTTIIHIQLWRPDLILSF